MIASYVPKLLLGVLLILTLSLKVPGGVSEAVPEQDEMVRTHIATFLARQGFKPDRAIAGQNPIAITGHSGGCHLLIADVAPQGWHRFILRRLASGGDQVFFVFRGRKYEEQPVWLTRLTAYWAVAVRNVGLNTRVEPVLGIVASPACGLGAMQWGELAENIAMVRR